MEAEETAEVPMVVEVEEDLLLVEDAVTISVEEVVCLRINNICSKAVAEEITTIMITGVIMAKIEDPLATTTITKVTFTITIKEMAVLTASLITRETITTTTTGVATDGDWQKPQSGRTNQTHKLTRTNTEGWKWIAF